MSADKEVPIIYLIFYKRFYERYGPHDRIIMRVDLLKLLREVLYRLPKQYDYFYLMEMAKYDLLERINRDKFLFKGSSADKKIKKLNNYSKDYFLW